MNDDATWLSGGERRARLARLAGRGTHYSSAAVGKDVTLQEQEETTELRPNRELKVALGGSIFGQFIACLLPRSSPFGQLLLSTKHSVCEVGFTSRTAIKTKRVSLVCACL